MGGRNGSISSGRQFHSMRLLNVRTQHESRIMADDREHLVCFDNNGNVLFKSDKNDAGDKNSVLVEEEDLEKLRNANVTHNHPLGKYGGGGTLSPEDVGMLTTYNMSSVRAVTPTGSVYELRKIAGAETKNSNFTRDYQRFINKIYNQANQEKSRIKEEYRSQGRSKEDYKKVIIRINTRLKDQAHNWLARNSTKYGYTYYSRIVPGNGY